MKVAAAIAIICVDNDDDDVDDIRHRQVGAVLFTLHISGKCRVQCKHAASPPTLNKRDTLELHERMRNLIALQRPRVALLLRRVASKHFRL